VVLDAAGAGPRARQVYEVVIKMDPTNGVALNNLAFLLSEHGGDLDDASPRRSAPSSCCPI